MVTTGADATCLLIRAHLVGRWQSAYCFAEQHTSGICGNGRPVRFRGKSSVVAVRLWFVLPFTELSCQRQRRYRFRLILMLLVRHCNAAFQNGVSKAKAKLASIDGDLISCLRQ